VLGREPGMALLKDRRLSFPAVELLELQGLTDGIIYDGTTEGLMAQSGQPHARLRRLVSAAFTPRQVERLRPRLRAYLAGLWQDIAQTGRCDVVTALARPLPLRHLRPDGEPVFGTPTGIYTMRSLPVRFTPHEPGRAAVAGASPD
jgi:hypothetical protein